MNRRIVDLVNQFNVTVDAVKAIYAHFETAVDLAESKPGAMKELFQSATHKYKEFTEKMTSLQNDAQSLVQEQEQCLEDLTEGREATVDDRVDVHMQRRQEQLERENNKHKEREEQINSLYQESQNTIERHMSKTPVQVEDDIAVLENIKRQLKETLQKNTELEDLKRKQEDRILHLENLIGETEKELNSAVIGQGKAALEVCWTILDCLRTNGGFNHHDIDAVLSLGNLSVYPLAEE